MDTNWLEYLLPIIFFVLYGISKVFGKGKKQDKAAPASPPPDIGDQQRRIQEEIRRRMAERRRVAEPAQSSTQTLKPGRPPPLPRTPFRAPEPEEPQVIPERESEPVTLDLQQQLAAQMESLREANRKSESLRQTIKAAPQKSEYTITKKHGLGSHFRQEIISMLEDAQSAKKAFLYSEIFGVPMGQRRQSTFAPLIDQ